MQTKYYVAGAVAVAASVIGAATIGPAGLLIGPALFKGAGVIDGRQLLQEEGQEGQEARVLAR